MFGIKWSSEMTNLNCCTYLIWMLQLFLCCVLRLVGFVCFVFRHTNTRVVASQRRRDKWFLFYRAILYSCHLDGRTTHTHDGQFEWPKPCIFCFSTSFSLYVHFLRYARSSLGWHLKWARISHQLFIIKSTHAHKHAGAIKRASASLGSRWI